MWHLRPSTHYRPQSGSTDWYFKHRKCLQSLLHLQSSLQLCGFWPAQLSSSILSRKVFTECRFQRHVKPPNLEDQWLERSNSRHQVSPTSETTRANPSSGRWNYGREIAGNFAESADLPRHFWVLLHAVNLRHGTDGFISPPKGGALRIFCPGLNPRTWVPKASTPTSRPPKPLKCLQ
jgi:hypothetical protein